MNTSRTTLWFSIVVTVAATPTYGTPWTWTSLDYPGARDTYASGISGNSIVGYYGNNSSFEGERGFLYDGTTWTTLDCPGAAYCTLAFGISDNSIVGGYIDSAHYNHGFLYDGTRWTTLDYPGARSTSVVGIDGSSVVGNYVVYNAERGGDDTHGFLYDGTAWMQLDYPGIPYQTSARGISGSRIVGSYADILQPDYIPHGFLYDGATWTTLDYPDARMTCALGISDNNIVGMYNDSSGNLHGFLYDGANWTRLDYPGASGTSPHGISGNNIVGHYYDGNHIPHGFLLTVPEPATFLLLALGGLVAMRRRARRFGIVVVPAMVAVLLLSAASARAVNVETVPVGNPGNAPDTEVMNDGTTGYGSVGYAYQIGKYEVTAGQYCEFLNAVAKTDTYGLYSTIMWSGSYGCKIEQHGGPGGYAYSVASDYANRPANYVSFWDACRFANWLHNGQPTGAQGAGTTETGAYTLNGYNGSDGRMIQRNTNWKWAVTSEDEWYKGAYDDPATSGYYDYPTSSNTAPGRDLNDVSGNNANYYGSPFPIDSSYYTTVLGEFQNSDSPYGTFDQGGNVWEWNESIVYQDATVATRGSRGGSFVVGVVNYLQASIRTYPDYHWRAGPAIKSEDIGFRVVQVPEPAMLLLLALGGLVVLRRRRSVKAISLHHHSNNRPC